MNIKLKQAATLGNEHLDAGGKTVANFFVGNSQPVGMITCEDINAC